MLDDLDQRLNSLELKCRRPVEHLLAGEYRSVFRGRGIEFEDVRRYQAGDDVRSMDWKVTARTGEPHIKRYIEEREQFIYLLVDCSASMRHGSHGQKAKTVSEICALITMAAIKNQDRVGLILFSDRIEQIVAPSKGRSHALRIMDALINFEPQHTGTDFVEAIGRFAHLARKHSVVFVVSDFLTDNYAAELQSLAFRHDVNAIHIADLSLQRSALHGLVHMHDSESGEQKVIDLKANSEPSHYQSLRQQMLESAVNLLDLEIGGNCVEALANFFHQRQRQVVDETGG